MTNIPADITQLETDEAASSLAEAKVATDVTKLKVDETPATVIPKNVSVPVITNTSDPGKAPQVKNVLSASNGTWD